MTLYMQPVQDLTIDATVSRDAVPVRARGRRTRRVRRLGAEAGRPAAAAAAARRCRQRSRSSSGLSAYIDDRPRHRRRASASRPATVDNALYDAFGQRIVSTIFTQSNQYRVILEADPVAADTRSTRSTRSTCRRRCRAAGQVPLSAIATVEQQTGAAADQPSRPVPGGDDLVQPRAGRVARRGGRRDQAGARRRSACRPASITTLPGRGAGLPGVARQRAAADPGGDRHHVHRAGRALRELHPPDHDPVDPALGRRRRAAGADAGRRRPRHHRDHRHHPADRHRQEERDHDDRLRAGRRARGGQVAARGDPPGVRCCASGRS